MLCRTVIGVGSMAMMLAACASGGNVTGSGASTSGTTTSSSSTGAGGMTGAGGKGTGGSGTGGGATGGSGPLGDHLLISEIGVAPAGGEFVEIYNPTNAAVDLSQYYLSDNSAYPSLGAGTTWAPMGTPDTDFLAQFPPGTSLAPGAVLVIAGDPSFDTTFTKCPDFILSTTPFTCVNGTAKAMVAPANGGIGTLAGTLLSNDREMVVLFRWDGTVGAPVEDVDYATWGVMFDDNTRADKTAVAGYKPDTARASQKAATAPLPTQSIERCDGKEPGEKASGGNGMSGHDETSEDLGASFKAQGTPTPGVKNACL